METQEKQKLESTFKVIRLDCSLDFRMFGQSDLSGKGFPSRSRFQMDYGVMGIEGLPQSNWISLFAWSL